MPNLVVLYSICVDVVVWYSTVSNIELSDDDSAEEGSTCSQNGSQNAVVVSESAQETSFTAPPRPRPRQPRAKRSRHQAAEAISERDILDAIRSTGQQRDQDGLEAFGHSVATTLLRFSRLQQALAKAKIQNVLVEVEFGVVDAPHPTESLLESAILSGIPSC